MYGLSTVYFGGLDLSNILKTKIVHYNLLEYPESSTTTARIAMMHKSSTSRYFTSKTIPLRFMVNSESCDLKEMEAIIARLRMTSQARWKDLTIESGIPENDSPDWIYSSDNITWHDVRIADFSVEQTGRIATVDITFIADDPIGYSNVAQTLFSDTGVTTSPKTFDLSTIDIQGTFYIQKPKYTLTVNSVTLGGTPSFTISNGFATLYYDGTIVNGDFFVMDTAAPSMLRNGNIVDFDGALPVIDLDFTTDLVITHTFSAFDYDILIDNNSGYI